MAIATDNGRLAVMELDADWEPGLPLSPGVLEQDDFQQLLWGFPEILWVDVTRGTPPKIDLLAVDSRDFDLTARDTRDFQLSAFDTRDFDFAARF